MEPNMTIFLSQIERYCLAFRFPQLIVLAFFCGLTANCTEVEVPFLEHGFDEAMEQANAEQKMVFANFYTTWCIPCKEMDRTTFKDQEVLDAINRYTFPVTVDGEVRTELVERFNVSSYPTFQFLSRTGAVLDRAKGYQDSSEFLAILDGVNQRDNSLLRAQRRIEEAPNDPVLRFHIGEAYEDWGNYSKALKHYLWCYDQGVEHTPSIVRLNSVRYTILHGIG